MKKLFRKSVIIVFVFTAFSPFIVQALAGSTCCDNDNDEIECHRVYQGTKVHIFYGNVITCDEGEDPDN